VFAGNNNSQAPIPPTLETVSPAAAPANNIIGVPFLTFNNNVKMSGPMVFWDLHAAYFYKSLAVIGEWGSGFQDYTGGIVNRTRLPVQSFYAQASYLVTGETRSSIGIVKPINPVSFGHGKGWQGTGAIEPFFRYEYMDIGSQVFTQGLADPNLWANRLFQTHVGANWHMTKYVKLYFDWVHAEFNQPVLYATGKRQLTSDMFLLRFQLFF
jgi:phosphate-selective porin OprO/OprP